MILRALSALSFTLGLACAGLAAARETFGVAFEPPSGHPYISLQLISVPIALTLALLFFFLGAILGRRVVKAESPEARRGVLGEGIAGWQTSREARESSHLRK